MGAGWDIGGAVGSVGKHSGGAGGFYGQVNSSNQDGGLEGIKNFYSTLSQGMSSLTDNNLAREKMSMEKDKFAQDMQMQQARLDMAKEDNIRQQMVFESQQKQQGFENELKLKNDERQQLKSTLDAIDFRNKEELANTFRDNIGTVTELLAKGDYEALVSDDSYKTVLAGLAGVDPKAALNHINEIHSNIAKEQDNKKAIGTYTLTETMYTEELPRILSDIDSGKSLQESIEPLRRRLADLYKKSGNIDHKAVTEQLKSILSMVQTYKSKGGASSVVSFDAAGNKVDPLTNPNGIARQVDVTTGKVTSVGGKSDSGPDYGKMFKNEINKKIYDSMQKRKSGN
jgi:hypothetical protein